MATRRAHEDDARDFASIFPEIYLRFHVRRDRRATRITAESWATLQHFAMSGPLTVGEASRHLQRAQSVVSEIVMGLEKKGLLARMKDEKDKRRSLIWLTDEAHAVMARERRVLDEDRIARAMAQMPEKTRRALVESMRALVECADRVSRDGHSKGEKR